MFARSVKIMTLQGFDIKVDPSWLLIATLITWSLATQYFPQVLPGSQDVAYIVLAVLAMLGFFGSLILHELAHSVVARKYDVEIKGITLFVFGGVAELGSEPKTPGSEFLIALAGPVMSLLLSLGFWFLSVILGQLDFVSLAAVINYLAIINLILALFNLLPAFPLDGGRIFRAYLWGLKDDFLGATRIATRVGSVFAYALMIIGLANIFSGALVAGIWMVFIGIFLLTAARGTYQQEMVKSAFKHKTVGAMMSAKPVTVSPDHTLSGVVNQVMLHNRVSFVPVVEEGVLLGYVDGNVLSKIDRENWPSTKVGDVYVPLSEESSVTIDFPVDQLMRRISQTGRRKFMVTEDHVLLGVITLSDLTGYLTILQDLQANTELGQHQVRPR